MDRSASDAKSACTKRFDSAKSLPTKDLRVAFRQRPRDSRELGRGLETSQSFSESKSGGRLYRTAAGKALRNRLLAGLYERFVGCIVAYTGVEYFASGWWHQMASVDCSG